MDNDAIHDGKRVEMTRREFLRRSAPLVAAGLVAPSFVEQLVWRLFGPKKYWDFGASDQVDLFTTMNRMDLQNRAFVAVDFGALELRVAAEIEKHYRFVRDAAAPVVLDSVPGPDDCVLCRYSVAKRKVLLPVVR